MRLEKSFSIKPIIILLFIITTIESFAQNANSIYTKTKKAVFRIEIFDNDDNLLKFGTGFFIHQDGIGLSNYHVFQGGKKARIVTHDGKKYWIENIISWSKKSDLIKFKIKVSEGKKFNFLKEEKNKSKIGDKVYVLGNPKGLDFSFSDGIISSKRTVESYGQIIQTTVPISSGNSGSPLINSFGNFIGIISFSIENAQNLNFAINSSELRNLELINKNIFPEVDYENGSSNSENSKQEINDVKACHLSMCDFGDTYIDLERSIGKQYPVKQLIGKNNEKPKPSSLLAVENETWLITSIAMQEDENITSILTIGIRNNKYSNSMVYVLLSNVSKGKVEHLIDGYYQLQEPASVDLENIQYVEIPVDVFSLKLFILDKSYLPAFGYSTKGNYSENYILNHYEFKK